MNKILIKNASIINEDESFVSDILIEGEFIIQIDKSIEDVSASII